MYATGSETISSSSSVSQVQIGHILKVLKYSSRRILLLGLLVGGFFVLYNESLIPTRYESSTLIKINFVEWAKTVFHMDNSKLSIPLSFGKNDLLSRKNLKDTLVAFQSNNPEASSDKKPGFLSRLVERFNLEHKPYSQEDEITGLQGSIMIQSDPDAPSLYLIKLRSEDPVYGAKILDLLISTFIKNKKEELIKSSGEIITALRAQLGLLEKDLKEANNSLALASRNPTNEETQKSLEESKKSLQETRFMLKELESRKVKISNFLKVESPTLPARGVGQVADTASLIQQKVLQLADLKNRYTDKHPDISILEKELAALRTQPVVEADIKNQNPVYKQLQLELMTVDSNLERARFQEQELEKIIQKGFSPLGSSIKSKLSIVDKLSIDEVNLKSDLANEEIRNDIMSSNLVPFIKIIDKAFSVSLLVKQRYVLMSIGLLLGIMFAIFFYWVRIYYFLKSIQIRYGLITELPDQIQVRLLTSKIRTSSGAKGKIYELSYDTKPFSKELLIVSPSTSVQEFEDTTASDIVRVHIASKSHSLGNHIFVYCIIITGYVYLLSQIVNAYFNQFYNLVSIN